MSKDLHCWSLSFMGCEDYKPVALLLHALKMSVHEDYALKYMM